MHSVSCTLHQKDGTDKHAISLAITPTVTFAGGKATKDALNWSDPRLGQSAAALDNNLGLLEGAAVEYVNKFFREPMRRAQDEFGK